MRKDAELTFENARMVPAAPLNICRAIRKHWRGQSSSPVQLANLRLRRGADQAGQTGAGRRQQEAAQGVGAALPAGRGVALATRVAQGERRQL